MISEQLSLLGKGSRGLERRGYQGESASLLPAFVSLVSRLKRTTPLAPLYVLAPSSRLLIWLEEALLSHPLLGLRLLNVRFHTFSTFITSLLPDFPRLELPLSQTGSQLLASLAVEGALNESSYFAGLLEHKKLPGTLLRAAQECEAASATPSRLRSLASSKEPSRARKLNDLAAFLEKYLELRASGGHVDRLTLEERAQRVFATSEMLRRACGLVLYGFDGLQGSLRQLIPSLKDVPCGLYAFIPTPGPSSLELSSRDLRRELKRMRMGLEQLEDERERPATLRHLQARLFEVSHASESRAPEQEHLLLFSAPDPASELRAILGEIQRLARTGVPYAQMAVAFRRGAPYASLVDELFTEYRIPYRSELTVPLHTLPLVRAFRSLLELVQSDLPREATLELLCSPFFSLGAYLTEQEIVSADVGPDVFAWDFLTRETGIGRGEDDWDAGITRLLRWRPRGKSEEDVDPADLEVRFYRQQAIFLRSVMNGLRKDLKRFPASSAPSAYVQILEDLLERLIDRFGGPPAKAASDRLGWEKLLMLFADLSSLDRVRPEVKWSDFRILVDEALSSMSVGASEGERRGVAVLELASLRGICVDTLFVGGMVASHIPAPEPRDLILHREDRLELNKLGAQFDLFENAGRDEKVLFCQAVAAARKRLVLSLHRFDSGGQEQLPSGYLREVWKTFFGLSVFNTDFVAHRPNLREVRYEGTETGVPALAFELSLIQAARSSELSVALPALERLSTWLDLSPGLHRAFLSEKARWSEHVTEYDGLIGASWASPSRRWVLSASQIELMARCPFQYLAQRVWRLNPLGPPRGLRRLERQPRGTLYHQVLFEIVNRWIQARTPLPGSRTTLLELEKQTDQLLKEVLETFEQEQPTGYRALWAHERNLLRRDILGFMRREQTLEESFVPMSLERGFGTRKEGDSTALKLPVEGLGEVEFTGQIDRIDLDPRRSQARVIDYKTGSQRGYRHASRDAGQGRHVQPSLYAAAAKALVPEGVEVTEFRYYFVCEESDRARFVELNRESLEAMDEPVRHAVQVLGRLMKAGAFFPWPEKDVCQYCDYTQVCRRHPLERFSRKRQDPRVKEYLSLREEPEIRVDVEGAPPEKGQE